MELYMILYFIRNLTDFEGGFIDTRPQLEHDSESRIKG